MFRFQLFLSSFKKENKKDLNTDNNTLNKSAVKNPFTAKPAIRFPANNMIIALITNKNNPSVKRVAGKVKTTNIGRTNIFNNAITTATIIAVV